MFVFHVWNNISKAQATSCSVKAWIESMTRFIIFVHWTGVESHWKTMASRIDWRPLFSEWLDSSHNDSPSSIAHKETSLFCFGNDQHWCKFSVCFFLLGKVGPDLEWWSRLQQNCVFFFRTRCQAKFLTYYCLSVIFRLKTKKLNLAITFFMCVVQIKTFWLDVRHPQQATLGK